MLKLDLTRDELDKIKEKVFFSDIQERIIEYRLRDYSITKMAQLEHCSESTINREIKKIKNKISKII